MNIQQIKVTGVEDKGQKIVLLAEQSGKTIKFEFFKTAWDKTRNAPGTEDSKPYSQYQTMPNPVGRTIDVDVFEKERTFIGREGKEITYIQRTINQFMLGGIPDDRMNPNGTLKPGIVKTIAEAEEIFS